AESIAALLKDFGERLTGKRLQTASALTVTSPLPVTRVERRRKRYRRRYLPNTADALGAAENEFLIALMAENNVALKREWVVGSRGPPGPSGARGEQGPPGKLPLVKLWVPETVYYAGDVVAYDGGTFQAKRDTGQPPSYADWICLAAGGRDGGSITVRG